MKQIKPIENSIDTINIVDILTMINMIDTIDTIQLIWLIQLKQLITIGTIENERKYKIMLHNQTVQINRSLYYGTSAEKHRTSWNYGRKQLMNELIN